MKNYALTTLLVCAIASISATALAWQDTAYFTIARLDAAPGSEGGYRVYPQDYSLPTAQNCTASDFAEIKPALTADREMMHRTLLAAFIAGRKVKLRLDGCGVTGRPAYRIITLSASQ